MFFWTLSWSSKRTPSFMKLVLSLEKLSFLAFHDIMTFFVCYLLFGLNDKWSENASKKFEIKKKKFAWRNIIFNISSVWLIYCDWSKHLLFGMIYGVCARTFEEPIHFLQLNYSQMSGIKLLEITRNTQQITQPSVISHTRHQAKHRSSPTIQSLR